MDGIRHRSRGVKIRVRWRVRRNSRTSSSFLIQHCSHCVSLLSLALPSTLLLRPTFRHARKLLHLLSLKRGTKNRLLTCLQRQSRSSARPAPRPASNPPPQSRGAHTAATPYQSHTANPTQSPPVPHQTTTTQQSSGPGMLAQMAATAGSVAVGSTIGHGISSMLFGGGGGNSQPVEQSPPVQQQQQTFQQSGTSCETQARGSSPVPALCSPN